ncbi:sulfite exporter TauE/SafE family protein [Thermoactinomyces mirandus]|uniref:Probable membrane transporter protein n=1 Tax=Thermoactinomyces mirandus TaxID=2756294 RepID=A0A7W1XS34_9BACL|nr:sulfite exporter TauE/SafE family protein [Thermoactinomyces mirandus]MBA4602020.1 sulfite exporter TauE/SafE family protein [Thermoactinomyces mirandus]
MLITLTMFVVGTLLGFIGAGGAGFVIAILTLVFHVPIQVALGTALASMAFTTLSGTFGHFREGNISLRTGILVGAFGAVGAFGGSRIAAMIPAARLYWLTTAMLFLSSLMLLLRLFVVKRADKPKETVFTASSHRHLKSVLLGLLTGLLAGTFGVGSTPFIQVGLLVLLGLSLRQSVGTTMLIILPIAIGGGMGYSFVGYLDVLLLFQVLLGTMTGAYLGSKFTRLAPQGLLKAAMVMTPAVAGSLMLLE